MNETQLNVSLGRIYRYFSLYHKASVFMPVYTVAASSVIDVLSSEISRF
jgi:hypothetical protein